MTNQVIKHYPLSSGRELQVVRGDITAERVDAIVNAANAYLQHGGGVAGAIVLQGGSEIQRESEQWVREHGTVSHGEPAYTTAGRLPCRYVIHAVGPVWGSGDEDRKLADAVRGSLARADELKLESIAFPAISTGIFGFPTERAARVMLSAISGYFEERPGSTLSLLKLVLYDHQTSSIFAQVCDSQRSDNNQDADS